MSIPAKDWDSVAATSNKFNGNRQRSQGIAADAAASEVGGGAGVEFEVNPFTLHAFLSALEESGSVAPEAGWLPKHLIVRC